MKRFVGGPRIIKRFDEDQTVVLGPEFNGKKRELIGTFTGKYKEGNALLDSLAPDLYAVLREILKSEAKPSTSLWEDAKALIHMIDTA